MALIVSLDCASLPPLCSLAHAQEETEKWEAEQEARKAQMEKKKKDAESKKKNQAEGIWTAKDLESQIKILIQDESRAVTDLAKLASAITTDDKVCLTALF